MNKKTSHLLGFYLQGIVIILLLSLLIFTTCSLEGDISAKRPKPGENQPPVTPDNNTFIVFDNTQGICAVSVYEDYRRRDEDKIAEISAGKSSEKMEWTPGESVPFYFSYRVTIKGINGFSLNYVPEIGKDQKAVRIDADTTTTIKIPALSESISSPDTLLSDKSYLLIQNNSSYSFQLLCGSSIISPDNSAAALVNSGERALYTINPGAASPYQLLVGADYKEFSGSIVSFEAGRIYSFVFEGNVSLITDVEIKLENVAGIPQNVTGPETPGAPMVTSADGLLTLRWIAVQGTENYEVYISTTQQPPASPVKTIAGTTTVLTGLINETVYYMWIKAANNSGSSDFSPCVRGIPWSNNKVPAVPRTPVIIPGINQLTVNWEECGGAVSYEVYINTSTTRPTTPVIITDKTSAVIKNLENDTIYYIWVRAVNSAGKSDYSPIEAGTPKIPTTAPSSPSRAVLTAGNHKLYISWQPVELAASYEVWYGTSSNSAQSQKYGNDITGDITETVITGLLNETTYYVWIKAKNIVGTSGFSPAANAKPSAFAVLPEPPAQPTVTPGSRTINVSWTQVEGALSYEVWAGVTDNPVYAQKYGGDVTGTSVTLSNLVNDTTYYLWVKAKNNIGTSEFSPQANGTPSAFASAPPAPQVAPTVISGYTQLAVSWQAVEGANSYEVWVGTDTNPTIATKRGDDTDALSAVITGLTNGTVYYIWIKAKNTVGTSNFSPSVSGTPSAFLGVPQSPSVPSITVGNGQITITWAATEGAMAYEVWMGTVNNSASANKNGADITASLSATIGSLTNGTTYYFWIKAKNSYGISGFSPIISGKPIANVTTPTISAGNGQLSVTWAAIAGADQYDVFCGTGINPPQTAAQTVTGTSVTISSLVNGTTYNVWVRGKNVTGTGAMSGAASAKPIGNMGTVTVSTGNGHLAVNWTAVAGADQYDVYYSTTNSIPGSPSQTVTTTTATISSLTNGTTYYVWVKGKNANGTSNASVVASGKPLGTPGTPTVSSAVFKQLLVTWTAIAGADEYEVYYGTTSNPTTLMTTTTGTTATITGLTNGTTYYVRLRGKNSTGISDYGPSASSVLNSVVPVPGLYRGAVKIGNQNLADSLTYISSNAVTDDEYYIVLGTDESISPTSLDYSGKTVGITLLGYNSEKTVSLNTNGSVFTVNSGVTLTLDENVTLVGRSTNDASLVYMKRGSTLIMNDRAKIIGNTNSGLYSDAAVNGGGVYINGIFTMNGGEISGNSAYIGGGVFMYTYGTFTMNGGEISGNTSYSSGGGVYGRRTFTMSGGTISGNISSGSSTYGGGVNMHWGTFTMSGGEISGNTSSSGGGVYVDETFIMSGGKISGNTGSTGGGVFFYSTAGGGSRTFTMSGGEISGNTGSSGGGVYNTGTFTMSDGTISGNIGSSGGGVYNISIGTFTMSGGKISSNTGSSGGGVCNRATFIMNGGEISGNTGFSGGGVYSSGTFTKQGGGTITGYASDTVNGNVSKNSSGVVQSNSGHAVYVDSSPAKRRETTAGPGVNINNMINGAEGGWEN